MNRFVWRVMGWHFFLPFFLFPSVRMFFMTINRKSFQAEYIYIYNRQGLGQVPWRWRRRSYTLTTQRLGLPHFSIQQRPYRKRKNSERIIKIKGRYGIRSRHRHVWPTNDYKRLKEETKFYKKKQNNEKINQRCLPWIGMGRYVCIDR